MKIALINCFEGLFGDIEIGTLNPGIATLEIMLRENNINNILILPQKNMSSNSFKGILKTLDGYKPDIVGLSTNTESYPLFLEIAKNVREILPESLIIAGGTHFQRQKIFSNKLSRFIKDSIEVCLEKDVADVVVNGHGSPLLKLINLFDKHKSPLYEHPKGVYTKVDEKTIGFGKGEYPSIERVPSFLFEFESNGIKIKQLHILADSSCNNRCDYCTASYKTKHTLDMVVDSIMSNYSDDINELHFNCSNPFKKSTLEFYERLFKMLNLKGVNIPKKILLEPTILRDLEKRKKVYELIESYNIRFLFFGRETTDGEISERIGLRYSGSIKDQLHLDEELNQIINFLEFMNKISLRNNLVHHIHFSYLLTPFENKSSLMKTCDEIIRLIDMSNEYLNVNCYFGPIIPYPGTKFRKSCIDLLREPEAYDGINQIDRLWDPKVLPQISEFFGAYQELRKYFESIRKVNSMEYYKQLKSLSYILSN